MTELHVENLTLSVRQTPLVEAASFTLKAGELVVLLGPNGAGKTSLIRGALGLLPNMSGTVQIDQTALAEFSPLARARQIAYLPQIRPLAWPNRVRDVVALGRFAHGVAPGKLSGKDAEAVDKALTSCDLVAFSDRAMDTLSGGELARVHCARAFATEAPLLIADEPTAALDPRHQFRILDLIKSYVDQGAGALLVLHDIELAARYADRLIWMKDRRIVAEGSVQNTLTSERLADVYGVAATIDGAHVRMEGAL